MNNFDESLEIGKNLIGKNINEALILFENLNKEFPNKKEVLFELGKIYYIKRDFFKAKIILEQIRDNNNYHLSLLLAKIYKSLNINFSALKLLLMLYKKSKNIETENEIVNFLLTIKKECLAIKFLLKNKSKNKEVKNIIKYYIDTITEQVANNSFFKIEKDILKIMNVMNKYTGDNEYLKEKNILLNEYEIGNNKVHLKSKPRRLTVFLTNKCNIQCKMCKLVQGKKRDIDANVLDDIKKIMPYLENIVWLGGEVFLYKDFQGLMDLANKYEVKQNIVTNGLMLNENIILKLMKYKVDLNISIDSVKKETYEYIRSGSEFEKILSNLKLIKNHRNRNMRLFLTCVVSEYNINEDFCNFIPFAKEYGFDEISFTLDIFQINNMSIINNFNKFRDKISDLAEQCGIKVVFLVPKGLLEKKQTLPKKKQTLTNCLRPFKSLLIELDDIRFFDFCKSIGNTKTCNIEEVWNSNSAVEFRQKMLLYGNKDCMNICNDNDLDFQRFKL